MSGTRNRDEAHNRNRSNSLPLKDDIKKKTPTIPALPKLSDEQRASYHELPQTPSSSRSNDSDGSYSSRSNKSDPGPSSAISSDGHMIRRMRVGSASARNGTALSSSQSIINASRPNSARALLSDSNALIKVSPRRSRKSSMKSPRGLFSRRKSKEKRLTHTDNYPDNLPISKEEAANIIDQYDYNNLELARDEFSLLDTYQEDPRFQILIIQSRVMGCRYYLIDQDDEIGYGNLTKVFRAYNLQLEESLVAKCFCPSANRFNSNEVEHINLEKRNNSMFRHKENGSYLRYRGHYIDDSQAIILLPYFKGRNLREFLYKTNDKIKAADRKENIDYFLGRNHISLLSKIKIIRSLFENIRNCHQSGIICRDLTLDNFVINCDVGIKTEWVDAGDAISIKDDKPTSRLLTSYGYTPPEVVGFDGAKKKPFSFRSDLYSLGVMCLEILSDLNYQKYLIKNNHHRFKMGDFSEVRPKQLRELFKDVFNPVRVQNFSDIQSDKDIEIFAAFKVDAHQVLQSLIGSLVREEPLKRLEADGSPGHMYVLSELDKKQFSDKIKKSLDEAKIKLESKNVSDELIGEQLGKLKDTLSNKFLWQMQMKKQSKVLLLVLDEQITKLMQLEDQLAQAVEHIKGVFHGLKFLNGDLGVHLELSEQEEKKVKTMTS